jgi:hypothetical protein
VSKFGEGLTLRTLIITFDSLDGIGGVGSRAAGCTGELVERKGSMSSDEDRPLSEAR